MNGRTRYGLSKSKTTKFALGGVAKIRHDEATSTGMPKVPSRKKTGKSVSETVYY